MCKVIYTFSDQQNGKFEIYDYTSYTTFICFGDCGIFEL